MIVLMKLPNSSLATLVHIKRHDCQCISQPSAAMSKASLIFIPSFLAVSAFIIPKKLIQSRIGILAKKKKTHPSQTPFLFMEGTSLINVTYLLFYIRQ